MANKIIKRQAKLVQVLEYMDGPQVVLLDRGGDHFVIAVAIERQGHEYPFFGADISRDQWEAYRYEYNDLRYLFMFPRWREWYLFDLATDQNGAITLEKTEKTDFVEGNYFPESGFFARHHSETVLSTEDYGLSTQKYSTDGKWQLPEFNELSNRIEDIYVFLLALKKFAQETVEDKIKKLIIDAFREKPLRGGSSYVHLYSDLRGVQTKADRFSTKSFRYASPGFLEVRGKVDIFSEVSHSLDKFSADFDSLKAKYSELYNYMQKGDLLKFDPEKFEKKGAIADFILKKSNELAEALGLGDAELIYKLTGKNALLYSKVLLAHFRRLETYFMFFAQGRIKESQILENKKPTELSA